MTPVRLGLVFCSMLVASMASSGCERSVPTPDLLAPLDRAVETRTSSPRFSVELFEPTADCRAILEQLESLGYVVDVSGYALLAPSILLSDLSDLADAVAEVGLPSQARLEHWSLAHRFPSTPYEISVTGSSFYPAPTGEDATHPDGSAVVPLEKQQLESPYYATTHLAGWSPLPIVLLPRFADLAAAIGTDVTDEQGFEHVIATSELWAGAMYFLPQRKRIVQYHCVMPMELFDGQNLYAPKGGPPTGKIGKIVGRPDYNMQEEGAFLPSARKIENRLSSREALGIITTGELTPSLWAFAAWEPSDTEGRATRQGFAMPLLDGNGMSRGAPSTVTPTRGSSYENLVLNVPDDLMWGRHVLNKLPRPMALKRPLKDMTREVEIRTRVGEQIVALIPSDVTLVPPVQAFVKAETWGPFAEDVVFTTRPSPEQLASGAVRALAVSASIERDELLQLLGAMAGHDPIESPVKHQSPSKD